ncbi:MAG TPA: helix-turn-helix transcriptional regulator [Polyangiaceae bacterium]|nr:helix-turn-helix transcriptional regulator [Polyangiaceae bacterium]
MEFTRYLRLVAANLRTARHRKGLTLDAATRGRGEYRYLWELEKGSRTPSLEKLFQLARRYGVTVADLVSVPGQEFTLDLSQEEPEPPKRGRKPKKKRKTKAA